MSKPLKVGFLMGNVSEALIDKIMEQVKKHHIVVWFDPQEYYRDVLEEIEARGEVPLFVYAGSFFALRREVDRMMEQLAPPQLLVYVPMAEEDTCHALEELVAAGVIMGPGQQPPSRNTRISVVARNALSEILTVNDAKGLAYQAESGRLSLRDLDALAGGRGKGSPVKTGLLSLIYGVTKPEEIVLQFLSQRDRDDKLREKGAFLELNELFSAFLGFRAGKSEDAEEIRRELASHLLLTELLSSLGENIPPELQGMPVPQGKQLEECLKLTVAWRNRRDLAEEYISHAERLERKLSLEWITLDPLVLERLETFHFVEERVQESMEKELLEQFSLPLLQKAEKRSSGFWPDHSPTLLARWVLIGIAGKIMAKSWELEKELRENHYTFEKLLEEYVSGDDPWCLLDRAHRMMETYYQAFEYQAEESKYSSLERLVIKARQEYLSAANALSQSFVEALRKESSPPGPHLQRKVFRSKVAPLLEEGKTAYFMVDALRFEMGWELARTLEEETQVELSYALAALPTITVIGMAALLPGAEGELVEYVPEKKKGLYLKIKDCLLRGKKERLELLKSTLGVQIYETDLESLLPPSKKERELIKEAEFVIVTSREIDQFSETGSVAMARKVMKEIVGELKRAVKTLENLGVQNIVIASDHGFILNEEIGDDMKIDPPRGEVVEIHRRAWVGYGGENPHGCVRFQPFWGPQAEALELVVPENLAVFRAKSGSLSYFHGGISPQEMVVPVITITRPLKEPLPHQSEVNWKLTPGSKKISTRFISMEVSGTLQSMAIEETLKVKVELREKKRVVSQTVMASYGFSEVTGEVEMKVDKEKREIVTNNVTLMVEGIEKGKVQGYLLDAKTGRELARTGEVEVIISI